MRIAQVSRHPGFRIMLLTFLALVMQIPILLIDSLVSSREAYRGTAQQTITEGWGGTQTFSGPMVVVPLFRTVKGENGKEVVEQTQGIILPDELALQAQVASSVRNRGIYEFPVYEAALTARGRFPKLNREIFAGYTANWSRAQIVMGISDPRSIMNAVAITWQGQTVAFEPGTMLPAPLASGIHAPLPQTGLDELTDFAFSFNLRGALNLMVAPMGNVTKLTMTGDWPNPGFTGKFLPLKRELHDNGFSATWEVPHLGRNYPQTWVGLDQYPQMASTLMGSNFVSLADAYTMTHRITGYAMLFFVMVFCVIWLIEIRNKVRVHPLQAVFIGAAMAMFYLLQLSLAEHIGFLPSYGVAVAATTLSLGGYFVAVLKSKRAAAIMVGVLSFLFTFLYVVLSLEDYALLVGTLGLFSLLVIMMYQTRSIDWSQE